jgi:cold shock protein
MQTGVVKWFDAKKGFGFILDGGGGEIFVHYKAIAGEGFRRLQSGETVEYEAADRPGGRYAVTVRPLGKAVGEHPTARAMEDSTLPG